MKLIKLFSLILMTCFFSDAIAQKAFPTASLKSLDGKTVSTDDFAKNGKITVISFWATWCSPCKKELDAIADIYPDWVEAYDMELIAVTIDTRRALSKVGPMVEQKGWEYTVLSDVNQELMQALNFQSVPMTYLLDTEGNIVYKHNSYVPGDEYELEDKIKALASK